MIPDNNIKVERYIMSARDWDEQVMRHPIPPGTRNEADAILDIPLNVGAMKIQGIGREVKMANIRLKHTTS